jgi:hypothetical protein
MMMMKKKMNNTPEEASENLIYQKKENVFNFQNINLYGIKI